MIPRRALAPLRRTAFVQTFPSHSSRRIAPTPIQRHQFVSRHHAPSPLLRALSTTSRASITSSSRSNGAVLSSIRAAKAPSKPPPAAQAQAAPPTPPPSASASSVDAASQTTTPDHNQLPPPSPSFSVPTTASDSPAFIDWAASYHGVASRPFPKHVADVLMAPVTAADIEIKPDGIIYLPEIKYRRILNTAFGPGGWGLVPRGEPVVGDKVVTREYVLVADGRFVSQAQGENAFFSVEQLPNAVEGCKSNALMRCCKDLGVASELWDPNFIREYRASHVDQVWVEHVTTKKKKQIWIKKGLGVEYPYKKV